MHSSPRVTAFKDGEVLAHIFPHLVDKVDVEHHVSGSSIGRTTASPFFIAIRRCARGARRLWCATTEATEQIALFFRSVRALSCPPSFHPSSLWCCSQVEGGHPTTDDCRGCNINDHQAIIIAYVTEVMHGRSRGAAEGGRVPGKADGIDADGQEEEVVYRSAPPCP